VRAVAGLHGMTVTLGDAAPGLVVRVALPADAPPTGAKQGPVPRATSRDRA
jgi:hypothetical protein